MEKFSLSFFHRILPCFLVVLLLVPVLLSVPVSAAAAVISGSCGTNANYILFDDGRLVISGIGDMKDYTSSSLAPWYSYASTITSIEIGEGITSVGNYAFYPKNTTNSSYAYSYSSLSLPDSLLDIGKYAFRYADGLSSLVFPSGLLTIGEWAFGNCSGLVDPLIIPASVESIGKRAFYNCGASVVVFESSVPPIMDTEIFSDTAGASDIASIIVPAGSLSAYQASAGLTGFVGFLQEAAGSVPDFTVIQSWDSSQVYVYQEETTADVFSVSTVVTGWNPSYQWFYGSSQGGTFTAMPAETLAIFTPKTTAEYLGTSIYFCAVTLSDGSTGETKTVNSGYLTVQVTEVEPPTTEPGGGGGSGGGDDPGTTTPDYSEKLDDISDKLDDVSSAITDSTDQIIDTINPETPELDNSLSGIDSDLNDVTSFEDDQIADINDNAHVITDSFVVLGNGSSLAAAFSFVSGILTGTFNELGIIQSVFILPLTIGLFLFLCSRVRGYDRPVRKDISNEYLRDSQRSMDGPADFRSSSLYDSDRDKSPL